MKKTAVITGASKGIGYATAKLFAEKGYNIVIAYNSTPAPALALVEDISKSGGSAIAVKADMGKSSEIVSLFNTAIKHFGSIDASVHNAGIAQAKLYSDLTDEDIDQMLNINLRSVMLCAREAVRHMLAGSGGNIVNISSVFGISGGACEVHYSTAKAGIIGLTKALAAEMALNGIRVNCVAPGAVLTPMNEHLSEETIEQIKEETPMGRLGTAEEIAKAIYFLCSDDSSYITGQVISPNGGSVR